MAEKPCNLLKNGGEINRNPAYSGSQVMWTANASITSAGLSWTAPKDGYIYVEARVGSYTAICLRIGGNYIGSIYTADTTEYTTLSDSPTFFMGQMRVLKGQVVTLTATYGVNAWASSCRYCPDK